ncbi:MAG: carboxypeptidase-like regulatory domain-containing protein [Bacteroidia bacterium]
MNTYIKVFLVFTIITLTTSCLKNTDPQPSRPSDPIFIGTLTGKINLTDAGGVLQTGVSVHSGISVSLSDFSGKVYTAVIDSNGEYVVKNINTGAYSSFTVTKAGYGTVKHYPFSLYLQANGDTAFQNFYLSQIPTNNISSTQTYTTMAGNPTENIIQINGTFPASTEKTSVVTFFSRPNQTSVDGTIGNYYTYFNEEGYPAGATAFSYTISCSNFTRKDGWGYTSGSTVFFATYIYGPSSSYYNPNDYYFPALSNNPIITSVILP